MSAASVMRINLTRDRERTDNDSLISFGSHLNVVGVDLIVNWLEVIEGINVSVIMGVLLCVYIYIYIPRLSYC